MCIRDRPEVYWDLTTSNVMVLEKIDGIVGGETFPKLLQGETAYTTTTTFIDTHPPEWAEDPLSVINVNSNWAAPTVMRATILWGHVTDNVGIDEYQIYEAKLMGADCILLIASILNDEEISHFIDLAEKLKLDYLIEVHDKIELDRVKMFENAIIGVNNRNLKTFEVDIQNSINLKQEFDGKNIFVSESGIKNSSDIEMLKSNGINVYLIGESLMRGKLL